VEHLNYADLSALVLVIIYYTGHSYHVLRRVMRHTASCMKIYVKAHQWLLALTALGWAAVAICVQTGPVVFYCLHL